MLTLVDLCLINANAEFTELLQVYAPEAVAARRKAQAPPAIPEASLLQAEEREPVSLTLRSFLKSRVGYRVKF